mgnify:CR=1 FL=1
MATETSAESPLAVRTVSRMLGDWIGRLGAVWIDGQVAEYRPRPGARNHYLTLRDTDVDMSLTVVADAAIIGRLDPPLAEGQRIVVHARPDFWPARGSLSMRARENSSISSPLTIWYWPPEVVHGKTSEIHHDRSGLFAGLPEPFAATRYHSLVLEPEGLPAELRPVARTADGTLMAIAHRELPYHGVQFHPESGLTPEGPLLMGNFLQFTGGRR